ncbi:hypothetical protein Trydic_g19914 [Trypoxylus dichotomus]
MIEQNPEVVDQFLEHISGEEPTKSASISATFPRTAGGNYDIQNKRLCNIENPVDQDCATRKYVLKEIDTLHQKNAINNLKQKLDKYDNELDKVIPLESKLERKLDALEYNARASETLLKQELKHLETRVKNLEQL